MMEIFDAQVEGYSESLILVETEQWPLYTFAPPQSPQMGLTFY